METLKDQLIQISNAKKESKSRRMYERYQAIKLHLEGYKVPQISNITGRCQKTVYNYLNAYQAGGLESVKMNFSTGRPSLLTKEQKQVIIDTLANKTPEDVGFCSEMNWTASILKQWIMRKFKVKYSLSGTNVLLHSLGFTCTRPTYTLANADPIRQDELKKTGKH